MFIDSAATPVCPPSGGPCRYPNCPWKSKGTHGPPDGDREVEFTTNHPTNMDLLTEVEFTPNKIYKHGPPDGGRVHNEFNLHSH
jgi:hypothetical protein